MRPRVRDQIWKGSRISYDDGQPDHDGVLATVLAVDGRGMTVQFDDRANTTYIPFAESRWMNLISVVE
jgi:hypothetical protein